MADGANDGSGGGGNAGGRKRCRAGSDQNRYRITRHWPFLNQNPTIFFPDGGAVFDLRWLGNLGLVSHN